MKSKHGFTLVELLVVIGIIALIGVFAAVAVNSARSKQRDATRLSNVRQLQSSLEDYFNENNEYPVDNDGQFLPLGDGSLSACLGSDGFAGNCTGDDSVFMRVVSGTYQDGLDDIVVCGDPSQRAFCYSQTQEGDSYILYFELENGLSSVGLQTGVNCATPDGMEAGTCAD